ncbi:serine protease [Bremerella sp. JC817]|uniref:trypsin-like serine peptidase n=1 Tax=Bremerella sp. JC817 TaxID=3231756 RepID=UPI003458C224
MLKTVSLVLLALLVSASLLTSPLHAESEDPTTLMFRATVKLSNPGSTGTGFILTPDEGKTFILVTAKHVLDKTNGDETSVVFRIKTAEGEYKKQLVPLAIRKDDKPLWVNHPEQDVAAIYVTPPADADLPHLPTSLLATEEHLRTKGVHPGRKLTMLGYPHREESSEAGFAILRNGPLASFPVLPTSKTKTFYISTSIFSGDSGGPVFTTLAGEEEGSAEQPLIMGVVHGQRFLNDTMKGNYMTIKTHHQFGLAIIVHASFVIETLELLK